MRKFRILFLCTGNSGRSQMAAAFASAIAKKNIEIISAGDKQYSLLGEAIGVMKEKNIEIPGMVELTFDDIKTQRFDVVVTLCNYAREICPFLPGSPAKVHWPLEDPGKSKLRDIHRLDFYRHIRDDIQNRIDAFFKFGFIESITEMRYLFRSLLNNLTDGVMAHDMDRRIFYFNRAAEQITGYDRSEVIGRDCHEVFPGKFCGGDCSFCDEKIFSDSRLRYQRLFTCKNGERRNLEMSVVTMNPPNEKVIGAMVIFRDISDVAHLRKRLEQTRGFQGIIGRHISMVKIFDSIRELANIKVPILIQGETGTGKEMVAMALHQLSDRSSGPFVPVNCGALPEGTLESELFGHVKGAFTGAIRDRKGRFELAEGGTIFLDEIGEISPQMQVKLLRVLQDNCFVPVGGEKSFRMNARVICATNRDLKLLTQQKLFREDLYYRLAVVPVNMPSLRERQSDIKLLSDYFLDKYSADIGKSVRDISEEALSVMMKYNWPGNVRELSNAIQYGMIKCSGQEMLDASHLPPEILDFSAKVLPARPGRPPKITTDILKETLELAGGNKAKAAKLLGISRTSLYRLTSQ